MYGGALLGGIIGGYIPSLWGAGVLDASSIFWGTVGTIVGIWAGYKVGKYYGLE